MTVGLTDASGETELWVEDTGIGVPPDDLPQLFSRFHRGRNAQAYPGSGLGLAIVKAIAERHGGRVLAENTGQGDTVHSDGAAGREMIEVVELIHTGIAGDSMDALLVREYRPRWQTVAEVEEAEQREATMANRWQRLNAILQMALALGLDLGAQNDDEMAIWQRWAHPKEGSA